MMRTAFALFLLIATPALAADTLLADLAGDWTGRGLFRRTAAAAAEPIYCKIKAEFAGEALVHKGRCASASNTVAIELTTTALGSDRYAGSGGGLGAASRAQTTFEGTRTEVGLDVVAKLIDTKTEKSATATASVAIAEDGSFIVLAEATDPETDATYTAARLVFAAR